METLVIAALAVWMVCLTGAVLLCVKQIGILTLQLDRSAVSSATAADDGPALGTSVPDDNVARTGALGEARGWVLMLTATCGACREVAERLGGLGDGALWTVLLSGSGPHADELDEMLPSWCEIIRDPDATRIAQQMGLRTAPFALELVGRRIVAKAAIGGIEDLITFMETSPEGFPKSSIPLPIERA